MNCMMALLDTTGKRLKALRADLGLSQKQLAHQIGMSQSSLSRLEGDLAPAMPGRDLARLAGALDTTTDYLLLLTGDPLPLPDGLRDELPDHIVPLVHLIEQQVPAQLQEGAIEYLRQQLALWLDLVLPEKERSRAAFL